jgi:hypothetical protein
VCLQRLTSNADGSNVYFHLQLFDGNPAMSDFDIDIVTSEGMFAAYDGYPYPSGSPHVQIPVSAGATYQIRLAGERREFELTTALR